MFEHEPWCVAHERLRLMENKDKYLLNEIIFSVFCFLFLTCIFLKLHTIHPPLLIMYMIGYTWYDMNDKKMISYCSSKIFLSRHVGQQHHKDQWVNRSVSTKAIFSDYKDTGHSGLLAVGIVKTLSLLYGALSAYLSICDSFICKPFLRSYSFLSQCVYRYNRNVWLDFVTLLFSSSLSLSYHFFSLFYLSFLSSFFSLHSPQFTSALLLLLSLFLSFLFFCCSWPLYASIPTVCLLLTSEATA